MGSSIRLFSRSQTIERSYSSNRYRQSKNCWGYCQVAPGCPSIDPVCPMWFHNHTRASHRCPNPTCPGGGNLQAPPGSCSSPPPRCVNCGGNHNTVDKDCESHHTPPPPRCSAAPTQTIPAPITTDEMDTATDQLFVSPHPSRTCSPQSAFEMATPRARRTTGVQAPLGPTQGTQSHLPAEPFGPSPMNLTLSGLAR